MPAPCQLTLGCAGTTNETPTKKRIGLHHSRPAQPANSGGLRMLYLWPTPLSSQATTSKLSRSSPLPVRPRVDFATLLVLPITAQSQSRLMRPTVNLGIHPRTTQSLSGPPLPPPTNATVTSPCGKGGRWHAGAVRACLHELCQGQVQMHVWRSCWRVREVCYCSTEQTCPVCACLGLAHVEHRTGSRLSKTNPERTFFTSMTLILTNPVPYPACMLHLLTYS